MSQLLVSATTLEIQPVLNEWDLAVDVTISPIFIRGDETDILITGVGAPAMMYHLTKSLQHQKYSHVCLVGIAGCFLKEVALGTLLEVVDNGFYDLAAEDHDHYIDAFNLDLIPKNQFPFKHKKLLNPDTNNWELNQANALSKNTISGREETIKRINLADPTMLETMEGAAFSYTCLLEQVKFSEIRAVSNFIEARNKGNWDISLAVNNLSNFILEQFKP